jgi:PAS domain S-box-containing protein
MRLPTPVREWQITYWGSPLAGPAAESEPLSSSQPSAPPALESLPDRQGGSPAADWRIALTAALLLLAAAVGVYLVFAFVAEERARELRAWQVRLGIVADSRAAAVDDWLARQQDEVRALAGNPTVQLFATELHLAGGDPNQVIDAEAQREYLHNLFAVTADRTGFTGPLVGPAVAANVEQRALGGLALVDRQGRLLAATSGFRLPALPADAGRRPEGGISGPTLDETATPALLFHAPVYALQGDPESGAEIGYILGLRQIAAELFPLLQQPGALEATLEAVLLSATEGTLDYLSPLRDGSAPLSRHFARDTAELAGAFAFDHPGGFALLRDYRDQEVLVTSRRLSTMPWVLAVKIDRAEALADSDARLGRLLIVLLLAIALAGAAILAAWRHGASRRAARAASLYRDTAGALEQQRNLLRLVTDSQPTSIFIVDEAGHYRFANRRAAEAAGIAGSDLLGKSLQAVLGPARAERFLRLNQEALASGRAASGQARLNGGATEHVLVSDHIPMAPSRSVLVVERDITAEVVERERRERALDHLVQTLVGIVDRRDPHAAEHSKRVGRLAHRIAEEMGLDDAACETAGSAGLLMNLGKILVPASLLTRGGAISDQERQQIHESLSATAELLDGVEFPGPVVETLRQAQEQVDGGGFPRSLEGDEILVTARIVAVANAFVGMVSPRAHRPALAVEQATQVLMQAVGRLYDTAVVAALVNYLDNRGGRADWQPAPASPALPPPARS